DGSLELRGQWYRHVRKHRRLHQSLVLIATVKVIVRGHGSAEQVEYLGRIAVLLVKPRDEVVVVAQIDLMLIESPGDPVNGLLVRGADPQLLGKLPLVGCLEVRCREGGIGQGDTGIAQRIDDKLPGRLGLSSAKEPVRRRY